MTERVICPASTPCLSRSEPHVRLSPLWNDDVFVLASERAHKLWNSDQRRVHLPYCYQRLDHDRHEFVYLPVNRRYKPLSSTARLYVDYGQHLDKAVVFTIDPLTIEHVWIPSACRGSLYLYNDDVRWMEDYLERLARVRALHRPLSECLF